MPIKILMPALSPTMTEGNIARWLKKVGEDVKAGDIIAEIETDKATMEVEAADEGRLGKILVPEGAQGVKVNDVIALLLEEGEDAGALEGSKAAAETGDGKPNGGASTPEPAKPAGVSQPPATASPVQQAPVAQPQTSPRPGDGEGRIFASPLAKRMATEAGIELSQLRGSGPHGRIVKSDIETAVAGGTAPARRLAPQPAAAPQARAPQPQPPASLPPFTEVPHSGMRRIIAQRLTEAKRDQPHFYLTIDCELDALLKLRADLNQRTPEGPGAYKLSVNDLLIKAAAAALMRVPAANASWTENAIRYYRSADISVAVAVPNGLVTPVIRSADAKGLAQISNEMKLLAEKARAGKLVPEDYQGGTFSLSNLGMYGIREFAAVINPPQGCILAVGAGEPRPVVKGGALAIATVMSATLSCDHRVVDGVVGAEWLAAFKKIVEDPLTMLL
ncbi:MAG TPA: pyruvate dehydrogenase complex dihydrolipoamide acetyltransferase [Alphaproteobacteria bacterium]|nr:pyruvate dehydrogenase complex dihydrolipoamide acetyltransferase [Alphaproteobacteria bacterium]